MDIMTRVKSARTLKEYFDICAASKDNHGVVAFPDGFEAVANLRYYTNQDIHEYALAAVQYYLGKGLTIAPSVSSIVGISAPGTLEWLATFIGLTRLGYSILSLSPNLSDEVLNRLLEKAECRTLITDNPLEDGRVLSAVKTFSFVPRNALNRPLGSPDLVDELEAITPPEIAFIWHSSGSTGLPKLMPLSQENWMPRLKSYIASPYGQNTTWICSAPYQSAGLTFTLGALAKPCWSVLYNGRVPLSGEGLVNFIGECRPHTTIYTAWALEAMANAPGGMEILKTTPSVALFGAICPQEIGDHLVRQGVNLSTGYAMSETSTLMTSAGRMVLDPSDTDWDYMSPLRAADTHMWFKPLPTASGGGGKDDFYELVVLRGLPNCASTMSNSNDPPGSFYTGDVFVKHPIKEARWKIIGRKDDQISMAFPPTVNAHDYETVVKTAAVDKGVEEVVLFGQGRKKLGMLIFVREGEDEEKAKETVWEVLEEKVNHEMKMRVEKDMIVAVQGQVPRTDKKNFMRAAVYKKYANVIDGAYPEANHVNGSI